MTFAEAYNELLKGKKVRRSGWTDTYWFIDPNKNVLTIHLSNGKNINYGKLDLTARNCIADDWEVVDDTASKE